jgi:hypothetical protein
VVPGADEDESAPRGSAPRIELALIHIGRLEID